MPNPTKNLTFNLSLTESQQNSKLKVPLPYEHEGKSLFKTISMMLNFLPGKPSDLARPQAAHILYDPDSADDLDDEDPDEDLDI